MSGIKKIKKSPSLLQLYYSKSSKDFHMINRNNNSNNNSNIYNIMFYTTKKRLTPLLHQIPNMPKHIIYYLNNQSKLEKLQSYKKKVNEQMQNEEKTNTIISLRKSNEEYFNIKSIVNPFKIENYSSRRSIAAPSTKKNSKSISCNMNKTMYRPMAKSPIFFNGCSNKNNTIDPFELYRNDRYAKKILNIEDILINHQANKSKSLKKIQIKKYQLKQSMLLNSIKQKQIKTNKKLMIIN